MRCLICKVTDSEVVKFLINCIWYSFGCTHLSKDCYSYLPLLIATYSIVSKHFNDFFFFFSILESTLWRLWVHVQTPNNHKMEAQGLHIPYPLS